MDFKSKLTRKYAFPKNDNENNDSDNDIGMEKPWEKYLFIDYDTWKRFVHSRHDPKFLEKSQRGQKRRKKNLYNHTMSRGGYAYVYDIMTQEKWKEKRQAARVDNVKDVSPPSLINRAQS
ncbi:uncharacterized protein LOC129285441 [Prosopis cineraria]|uniref:uncharacterized protein LOC129285441 n=1 Tax=Prosopis cineraria TaxID=364024 RepID=UPI002410327F|nr:uncharacterized protein LOC129285441 [Prosopis cineraria]